MKRIDDLIDMYKEIVRKEEPIIISKLRMINELYAECEASEDAILFDEIINTLADVIQRQKEIIDDMRADDEHPGSNGSYAVPTEFSHNYIVCPPQQQNNFETDEQIQAGFAYYLTHQVEKPLSSYTINDYCSRIRNLWKSFYNAHKDGELPEELYVSETASFENPLVNAYNHIEELNCYVGMMSAISDEKRNWANIGAALNKFISFIENTDKKESRTC